MVAVMVIVGFMHTMDVGWVIFLGDSSRDSGRCPAADFIGKRGGWVGLGGRVASGGLGVCAFSGRRVGSCPYVLFCLSSAA